MLAALTLALAIAPATKAKAGGPPLPATPRILDSCGPPHDEREEPWVCAAIVDVSSLTPRPEGVVGRRRKFKPDRWTPVPLEKSGNNAQHSAHPFRNVLMIQTRAFVANVAAVKVFRDDKIVFDVSFPAHYHCDKEMHEDHSLEHCTYYVNLREIYRKDLPNGALLKIVVKLENQTTDYLWYTRVHRPLTLYRIGGSRVPVWIPAGLFGSNFRRTSPEGGVPFAVLPAGVAIGGKYHFAEGFHLGLSALALYTILPTTQVESSEAKEYPGGSMDFEPSPNAGGGSVDFVDDAGIDSDRTTRLSLLSLTVGGLVDVGGFLLVGGGAAWDFTSPRRTPSPIFIIGVGPSLLSLLQGGSQ